MQVFKYYFRLAWAARSAMFIYLFSFVAVMMVMSSQMPTVSTFSVQKPRVVVVNNDVTVFTQGLTDYLNKEAEIKSLPDTDNARKDALYFQTVDAIYTIPAGFTTGFFAGKPIMIDAIHGTGQGPIQADSLVSNYLRLATPRALAGMGERDVVDGIKADLAKTITVETKSAGSLTDTLKAMYYNNLEAYILLGLNIMVISFIMLRFNERSVRNRNLVSGMPYRTMSLQLFAGNVVFSLGIWVIFFIVQCLLYPSVMLSTFGLLYGASSLAFSFVALAIGFMVGSLLTNRRAIPAITNIVALGMAFLCGVFVPQQLLGETVVNASKLLPAYWFVNANDTIADLTNFSWQSLQPIIVNWTVVVAFAAVLFIVTFVLVKRRAR